MKKILTVLALAAAVLGVSCDRPEEPQVKPTLTVSPSELAFAASGNSSKTVTVTAENVGWEITMSDESKAWITVTENSDGKTLTVSVSDNEAETARNGSFTLTPDNVKVDPKRVTVSQEGAEVGDLSFSLDPTALTFDGEGAPAQEVVVAVSDAKLTWTAAPEEAAKDWITVTASGDKISVSVADNPDTTERSGNVIVTPDTKSVNPKAVRVTQKGKVLPPSLSTSVESGKLEFDYSVVVGTTVYVTAVDVNWDAKVSDTPDVVGNPVEWLKVSGITKENVDTPYFSVRPETNTTTEARSAYVVVTSDNPEVPNVTIEVVQAGGKEFLTNLTAPVEITDMGTGVVNDVFFSPNQKWLDRPIAMWSLTLLAPGVERSKDWMGYWHYTGVGTRLYIELYSERIVYNDDGEYYLPDGDYAVAADEMDENDHAVLVPFTVKPGEETNGNMSIGGGSWYLEVIGDAEEDVYGDMAPISSGTLHVARSGEEYTLTMDFKDDAGFSITGTCVTKLDNIRVNFFERPDPSEPEEPEDPDEGGELPPFGPPTE